MSPWFLIAATVAALLCGFAIGWLGHIVRANQRVLTDPPPDGPVVYYVRHQAAGVLHEFPFSEPPTQAQLSACSRLLAKRHVRAQGKDPWWLKVVSAPVLDSTTLPFLMRPPTGTKENVSRMSEFHSTATGHFTSKKSS
jgi:hypothetical protein